MSRTKVSPTAYYTAHVWTKYGLASTSTTSWRGRAMYACMQPMEWMRKHKSQPTWESLLHTRHICIDYMLECAIESGEVSQVIELASGLSARGARFTKRYPDLVYVESDLPHICAQKEQIQERSNHRTDHHYIVPIDALSTSGSQSLKRVAGQYLDKKRGGIAVISEGLLPYLTREQVQQLWAQIVRCMEPFPTGIYLSDMYLSDTLRSNPSSQTFRKVLQMLLRSKVHWHFRNGQEAADGLSEAGFKSPQLLIPNELNGKFSECSSLVNLARAEA